MKAAYTKPFIVAAIIIIIDQVIKTWVRTHMNINEDIPIFGDRGMLHYTENNGMAFGWELGGVGGKLALTIFRIIAVAGIGYGVVYLIKHKYHRGLVMNVALIFAGAVGNIIDSTFYGIIYQNEPLFQGRVVDMFYFPIIKGHYPDWFPFWKGEYFEFFQPVFNFADAAISVGVIAILIWQKRYFKQETVEESNLNSEVVEE
ncbi:lipoprotein signal peptidase [Mucilaginibacter myungsuensis]|uniref:Lipoprotein signal peptidase n=1 Tax=Mucilaginibacter myungsuensis TaxID=649104 RepID=A0A929L5D9_9SPHI|nr:lipoprotein signal peptidase [Mucilaginibacter myungsuensis]MBE9663526.1 lipoprotein signal peptidase [Mucilaginibacter myungsuensis]MDN3600264.1 lipoprotein signal peptidase [Mucilaginibacter myungsuensis]